MKNSLIQICSHFQDSLSRFDSVQAAYDLWHVASLSKSFSPEELHQMKQDWLSRLEYDVERRKAIGERNFDLSQFFSRVKGVKSPNQSPQYWKYNLFLGP